MWVWELLTWSPNHSPILTEFLLCHNAPWTSWHFHGKQLAWTLLREGSSTHSGSICSLYDDGSFPENVCQLRVNVVFQTLQSENPQHKISFGNKICDWKSPTPQIAWIMKKGKIEEELHMSSPLHGNRLLGSGKISTYLLCFNLNPTSCHLSKKNAKEGL